MTEKELIDLIKSDLQSKSTKYKGRKYYYNDNEKKPTEIDVADENGNIVTIDLNNNTNLYVNHMKLLVNQKIDYLLLKEVTIKNQIYDTIEITNMLEDILLNASLDGIGWIHFYINEENKLDWILIEDSEIIPIYDNYHKYIKSIIRYFLINKDEYKIEIWNKNKVVTYILKKDKLKLDCQSLHYTEKKIYDNEVIDVIDKSFDFIPFVPLFNNKSKVDDSEPIDILLDMYNWISSGIVDNIDKFQEAITKLKGFSGESQYLEETMKNLKKYKAVGIPDPNGDVDYVKIEIPIEARKFIIDLLEKNIFKIGQGFDSNQLGDGNITNVVIKSRYVYLDHKVGRTIKQLKQFYKSFIDCVNKFYRTNQSNEIEFNISQLINENEIIDCCMKSLNIVSRETIVKKHPWVSDYKQELKLLENEEAENFKKQQEIFNHPDLGGDDDANKE